MGPLFFVVEGMSNMAANIRIRRLNTGWLESSAEVSLMGGGKHPDVPGGQIKSYGWRSDIRRPDGSAAQGTMVPAPAWLIEGAGPTILVDTGTGKAQDVIAAQQPYGISLATITEPDQDIVAQLARLGVTPDDIDIVIHTHLHFDHVGSDELFPKAVFLVHEAEIPWALCPPPYGVYYYREFSHHVRMVLNKIQLVHGDYQVTPEVRMTYTGGHSPGHSVVFVKTAIGTAVVAGDAVYNYRNLEFEWPQGPLFDVQKTLRAMQTLKTADIILLNHDPLFTELFPNEIIGEEPLSADTNDYMTRLRTSNSFPLSEYVDASLIAGGIKY